MVFISAENAGVGQSGLAQDDPIGVDDLTILDDSREELRHVVPDMELAGGSRVPSANAPC